MNYDGVIFDLDGVICFTDQYHYQAWKVIADEIDTPFDEEINNRLRGVSRMESLAIILENYHGPALTTQQKEQLATQKNAIYRNLLQQMTPADLHSDVKQALDTLRSMGLKLAIGSSSKNAPLILARIGLDTFFDAVVDGNHIAHSKPHPEVFLKAAAAIGLPARRCLVVEDAEAGIEAAVAGGFNSAGIGVAATAKGVTHAITTLAQLPALM
ncbi:beta-phosphoglucomutase [Ruminococcaceae bacterium OttesenSCG-928-A16]|nr:beta-phosphoglucomutase [Ruminococcaceae bacterium OttesenSCG-928-A16]